MKTILFFLLSTFTLTLNAQDTYMSKISVSPYVGLPNTLRWNLAATEGIPSNSNVKYSGLSPFGIRGMYSANDKVSIGLDLIYGFASAEWATSDSVFINGVWTTDNNDYKVSKMRFRPQFRFNKHWSTGTNLDHYAGFSIGGNSRRTKEWVNNTLVSKTKDNASAISLRICYGFSYGLTPHLGLGGEIGLGGPLLQMALTYKI